MNRHAALLPFAVFIALAAAQANASATAPTSAGAKTPEPASQALSLKSAPAAATGSANPNHLMTVRDERGLLLTCVAPEIETNLDTDVFKNCVLAPGRTLDDVMHTFIQGIHYEQSQHQKDRDLWLKYLEENASQKPAK
jgi:hypothetical protein